MRVAAIQLRVDDSEAAQVRRERAFEQVRAEAGRGADLVVLPELWAHGFFSYDACRRCSEPLDGATTAALGELACECGVVLCGGSFVERDDGGLYNTTVLSDVTAGDCR